MWGYPVLLLCVRGLCVSSVRVRELLCVRRKAMEDDGRAGSARQKQEPHTKMWETIAVQTSHLCRKMYEASKGSFHLP